MSCNNKFKTQKSELKKDFAEAYKVASQATAFKNKKVAFIRMKNSFIIELIQK